jgi:hypothetical protein
LNQPTQEDFEAWRRTKATIKRWGPVGSLRECEAELAWVYLCEFFGFDFTNFRCCAKRHIGPGAPWPGHPCENPKEKCWKGSALATMEGMDVLRTIDNLVEKFVANDNMFPLKAELVPRDRIEMVLEDLNKTPPGVD